MTPQQWANLKPGDKVSNNRVSDQWVGCNGNAQPDDIFTMTEPYGEIGWYRMTIKSCLENCSGHPTCWHPDYILLPSLKKYIKKTRLELITE